MTKKDTLIDWDWVRQDLLRKEKIGQASHGTIMKYADECLKIACPLTAPRSVSIEKKVLNIDAGSIEVEGGVSFSGSKLSSYLKGAVQVRVFLVTIGASLEDTASRMMKDGDQLHGYLLDSIGSIAVESMACSAEEALRKALLDKGLSVSMRFSPGYCDWPIEEQFKVAKILDFGKAGVELNKNCMMVPKKSISFMVGIGPKGLFADKHSQCDICELGDCDFRRTF